MSGSCHTGHECQRGRGWGVFLNPGASSFSSTTNQKSQQGLGGGLREECMVSGDPKEGVIGSMPFT